MAIATAQDKENIKHLSDNFYSLSQEIIEKFYLKPLSTTGDKQNLKDGAIERPIHGGMHVGRAQFYPTIIHNLMQKNFPELTKNNINILTETLGLTEQEILFLTRYAVLFHDSARQGEGRDIWDDSSANNFYDFLINQGISEPIAVIFSKAAAYKDKPDKYTKQLSNIIPNITAAQIQSLQYIRKLIYLADCLDIMRCVDSFKLTEIYKAFTDIPEKEHQQFFNNDLLELVKNIHALINKQKDMLYDCKVLQTNGLELTAIDPKGIFDLREKVKYEHANNVCSAIGASMFEEVYFAQYLEQEKFTDTTIALVTPEFNPFIHGTNALALPILEKTNLALMSPIDMLEKFNLAPFGGEITGGGLGSMLERCNPCFARLKSDGPKEYTLDKVISNYSNKNKLICNETLLALIKETASKGPETCFQNINILLIYIARARQLGIKPMEEDDAVQLISNVTIVIQYLYLFLLLNKYSHIDYAALSKFSREKKAAIVNSMKNNYTYKKLIDKIKDDYIDIKFIYNNPTEDNLNKIWDWFKKNISVEIPFIKLSAKEDNYANTKSYDDNALLEIFIDHNISICSCTNNYDYTMMFLCYSMKSSKDILNNNQKYKTITTQILQCPEVLEPKLSILNKLLQEENITSLDPTYMEKLKIFTSNPFPIIFVSENEENIRLVAFSTQEYRSNNMPLNIGSDIKMIATDTRENRLLLMKFLEENRINNVQVVLFDQLKASKISGQPPKSPHIHRDGAPTLAWLAAKTISKQPKLLEQFESKMLTMKDKLDPTSMIELVDDANKLDNIRLTP